MNFNELNLVFIHYFKVNLIDVVYVDFFATLAARWEEFKLPGPKRLSLGDLSVLMAGSRHRSFNCMIFI